MEPEPQWKVLLKHLLQYLLIALAGAGGGVVGTSVCGPGCPCQQPCPCQKGEVAP